MTYLIRFDFPEGTLYAGLSDDALGFAPSPATAILSASVEEAGRWLANGYAASAEYGYIVDAETGERAEA